MAGRQVKQKNTGMAQLQSELKEGTFHRVYLFFGEERYLVLKMRENLVRAAVSPDDTMNLNIHKNALPDVSKIMDECLAMPFFADRRVVLVQDSGYFTAGKGKDEAEKLIGLLGELPETTILLFVETEVDKRSRLYKAVSKAGLSVEFEHPDEMELARWVVSQLSESRIRITKGALQMLLERTGADMTMIRAQLDKLAACADEGGTLSETEVGGLVAERLETKVFDLVDAVGHRDRRGAISRYDELLRMQEEPNRILYFLGRQFNLLYLMKVLSQKGKGTVEMMKVMDLRYSFQIRKLSDQARFFTADQLRRAVADCTAMEQRFKTGKIDVRLGVELLLVKYSRPDTPARGGTGAY